MTKFNGIGTGREARKKIRGQKRKDSEKSQIKERSKERREGIHSCKKGKGRYISKKERK